MRASGEEAPYTPPMDKTDLEMVYIGDPMCSWCWGFSPSLDALDAHFDFPLRVVVGGLRPGPMAQPVDDKLADFVGHHWHQVEAASGQPFDHTILGRRGWSYDTEPSCIAVAAVRELAPENTLAFFARLHRAFYAEGVDITDPAVFPALAADYVPDVAAFSAALASEPTRQAAWRDFAWAKEMGVTGFPTLMLRKGEQWIMVTQGFRPSEQLIPAIATWLDRTYGEQAAAGMVCAVDGSGC